MKTVCLFDIDGTLLNSGGAGQHAMEQALAEVFQVAGPYHDIPAAGRTDKAITTDLFAFHKLTVDPDLFQTFLAAYLSHLPKSLNEKDGRVLPGVVRLLEEMVQRNDTALGLLTGNFEVGARLKLEHYAIDHYFRFGGYGDHHPDRDDVARVAKEAALQHMGTAIDADRVWVIGDTPSDVRCARAIGAKVIAVATGIYGVDELEESQPDRLYEDLSATEDVLSLIY